MREGMLVKREIIDNKLIYLNEVKKMFEWRNVGMNSARDAASISIETLPTDFAVCYIFISYLVVNC